MTEMSVEEAHIVCQDVSSTLEQAYTEPKARLVLGFWGASLWPKSSRKIFSAKKAISINGDDAEKVCAYLNACMPTSMTTYTSKDRPDSAAARGSFTAYCNKPFADVINLDLDISPVFNPWPRLKQIAAQFSDACAVIQDKRKDFDAVHRDVVMETLGFSKTRTLYSQVTLSWAGWGALCLGRPYFADEFPVMDPVVDIGNREPPIFEGLIAYRGDWMIILAKCAGKDIRRLCPVREFKATWDRGVVVRVCEIWRTYNTKWVFELANEMEIEQIKMPQKPKILMR